MHPTYEVWNLKIWWIFITKDNLSYPHLTSITFWIYKHSTLATIILIDYLIRLSDF